MRAAHLRRLVLGTIAIPTSLSGCAQILGIDETSSNNVSIEIQLQRVSVGASVVTSPLDVGSTPPAFLVQDSSDASSVRRIPSSLVEPGRWAAPLKSVGGVAFTPAGGPARVLMFPDFTGSALTANYVVYEHPNPEPAPPPPADVRVDVTLPSPFKAGEGLAVVIPGAWVYNTVNSPPIGATSLNATIPYTSFSAYGGTTTVGKFTSQDAVTVLRYENNALTGQFVAPPLDQATGTTMITGVMAMVTASTGFSASLSAATVASRFTTQVPPPTAAASQEWRIEASPGHAFGLPAGISLANGTFTPTDTAINGVYANPFPPQWRATLSYLAKTTRTFSIGGAAASMDSQLQSIVEAGPGLTLDMPAGLPTMTSVNSVPLNSDGMTVALDVTKQVMVDITSDRTQNTLYEITLVEIAVVGSQVIETPIVVVSGVSSRLPLPPRSMQTGHTYNLRIRITSGGYTNASTGDLQTFALPVSYGYQEGAVFTVISPP